MNPFHVTLTSKLLSLRLLTEADRESLFVAASDPLIWEQHPSQDRYLRPVFDRLFDSIIKYAGPMLVTDRATGKVIGTSSFYDFQPTDPSVCIGYTFLIRQCWGHTYNREMKQLMINYALKQVSTVYFHIGETNLRSQAAIKKIGAIEFGKEIRFAPNGMSVPTLIFKITKPIV